MKRSSLFTPALALAFGLCATGAMATTATPVSEDFEGGAFASGINGVTTNNLTWADTEGYSAVSGGKLVVDAADTPTSATIDSTVATNFNGAIKAAGRTASFTAKVNFTPATETPEIGGADLKFALYAKAAAGSTNLMVLAKQTSAGVTNEIDTGFSIDCSTDTTVSVNFTAENTFEVAVGSETPAGPYYFANNGTIAKVEFAGNGDVDDIGFSYDLVDTTITWPTTMTVASYTVDGGESVALVANSGSATVSTEAGAAIALTLTNADGATKTINGTAGTAIDATAVTFGWADYLGAAVDGAYEIDNLAELKLFQKGVAAGLPTASTTFKLTADVTLDIAWPGIGVQNGKDIYTTSQFEDEAFCGTFDGQNNTISGFQMIGKGTSAEGLDYCGFFNSTYGATIQNLKIQYAGSLFAADTTASTKESGATFVGVAKNSTLRNLTSVAGTVSCSKGFGGIVGYLTSGTTVDSCTNNVNMTSLANNKCGGIAMIAQGGSAVTISNCQNNGTQTTGSSNSEYGAIVGYVGLDITIANCETTVGRFLKHQGNTVTLQGVNKGDATVLAYHGAATPGLNFATVSGNVATFVADTALAAGNTYKVMGPSATATFAFAAAGTIAFDTALATPTYAITAPGLVLSDSTSGTVTTYTARNYAVVNVTVTGGANATAAWTVNGATVAAPATLTEGDTYSVTYTANEGYEFAAGAVTSASGTAGTGDIAIVIDDAVSSVTPYGDDPGEIPAVEISGSTHTLTDGEADYLNDLVEAKGGTAAAQAAVEAAVATITEQAFADAALLNQDITDDDFRGGTAKFEISNIRNVSGGINITVKLQPASKMLGNQINGHVNLYAYNPASESADKYEKVAGKEFVFTFANPESPAATEATVFFEGDYSLFKAVIEE